LDTIFGDILTALIPSIWASNWCFNRGQEYSCYSKGNLDWSWSEDHLIHHCLCCSHAM